MKNQYERIFEILTTDTELDEGIGDAVKGAVNKIRDKLGRNVHPALYSKGTKKKRAKGRADRQAESDRVDAEDTAFRKERDDKIAYEKSPKGIKAAADKKQNDEFRAKQKAEREADERRANQDTTNDVYGNQVPTGKPRGTKSRYRA